MITPSRVAGIVLAAGASRRLGTPKQLARIDGEALVHSAVRAVSLSRCSATAVVVGANAAAVVSEVADLRPVILRSQNREEGIASSIRTGTSWALEAGYGAVLLVVCDQPLLDAAHLDALIEKFRSEGRPVGSGYSGVVGTPAVFGRSDFRRLLALQGDRGAAALLRRGAGVVFWADGARDIDTLSDFMLLGVKLAAR